MSDLLYKKDGYKVHPDTIKPDKIYEIKTIIKCYEVNGRRFNDTEYQSAFEMQKRCLADDYIKDFQKTDIPPIEEEERYVK